MADGGETLKKAVEALINDDLPSPLAKAAHDIAVQFLQWISVHKDQARSAEEQMERMLTSCFQHKRKRQAAYREVMWSKYHTLRTSKEYLDMWLHYVPLCSAESCPHFFQYVGHHMFKDLIRRQHPITPKASAPGPPPMTYEEANTLRYVAGYIPRLLRDRMKKSSHCKLKEDIKLCIFDLLDDGDDNERQYQRLGEACQSRWTDTSEQLDS